MLPRSDRNDFLDNEFLISEPGFEGDIGTIVILKKRNYPIIGIYNGEYTYKSKTYGRFMTFPVLYNVIYN